MNEFISPAMANGFGVVGIVVAHFFMLSKGILVTRRENDATIADRDMWRETAQTLTPVVTQVLTEAETTNRLIRALPGIPEVDKL